MYLATTYWRGALNIGDMRLFDGLDDAVKYLAPKMMLGATPRPVKNWYFYRVYEFSGLNAAPKLVKKQEIYDAAKRLGIP